MSSISSYYNASMTSSLLTSMLGGSDSIFDVSAATSNAEAMLAAALGTDDTATAKQTVASLTKDTADFLDRYVLQMKELGQSTQAIKFDGLDKLLHDSEGNITEDTVAATVDAVNSMLDEYNNTLDYLNANSGRGNGVLNQIEKLARGPMAEEGLALVGISIESDGSLTLDEDVLSEALQTDSAESLRLTKELLSGSKGLADKISQFSNAAVNVSAQSLIGNDLAEIQSAQSSINGTYTEMLLTANSGAYTLNNIAALGMLDTTV